MADKAEKPNWGPWLRAARKAKDWTQQKMAAEGRIKRTTYANYELGTSTAPPELIERYKDKGIMPPPGFIREPRPPHGVAEVSRPLYPVSSVGIRIPKGPGVPCSDWSDPLDAGYEDFVEVDIEFAERGAFACEILGDSMFDLLQPGDLAIFKATKNPKIGTIIIARNEENKATCKQLLYNNGDFVLHSLNLKYEDVTSSEWTAIGFLIGIIRRQGSRTTKVFDPDGIRP